MRLVVDVYPQVTRLVSELLIEMGEQELGTGLLSRRFHGRCRCRPDCQFVLTAPVGSSGTYKLWLEVDGDPVGEVSVDPAGEFVTDFSVSDCETAGVPANWWEAA